MWQIAKDGDWAARRQLQKQFPVVSWHDDKVGGLDANWNCEAPISELCIFKQMIQNVIAFFFLPTSSVWQSNKGLWQETSWNHSRWLPGASELMPVMHSHPLPCKEAQDKDSLFLQAIRQLGCMRSPPSDSVWPWQCWSLWCSFPICLLSKRWSGFCSWAILTAALTLQSAFLSLPGQAAVWPCAVLKGCVWELKKETRGSSWWWGP